jgi:hypothetical protein
MLPKCTRIDRHPLVFYQIYALGSVDKVFSSLKLLCSRYSVKSNLISGTGLRLYSRVLVKSTADQHICHYSTKYTRTMTNLDNLTTLFKSIGLSEVKAKETAGNKKLSTVLKDVLNDVQLLIT